MTRGQQIEYELVARAVKATDGEGASVIFAAFVEEMRKRLPGIDAGDVLDALKRLHLQQILILRKWHGGNGAFADYSGDIDDGTFFYSGGDFRVKRTPFSRTYLEQFEPPEQQPEPPKRPIGFTS